jgi:hypothetical protein
MFEMLKFGDPVVAFQVSPIMWFISPS